MDITLINPPEQLRIWAGIPKAMAYGVYCFPPLGLQYVQASVEARTGFKAEIFDPVVDDLDFPDFEDQLKRYPLDLVGIEAYTHSLADVQMSINIVRKLNPNATIVVGGPHCSMFPEYAIQLDGIDATVNGDGEDAFVEIANAYNEGRSFEGIEGVWFKDGNEVIKNQDRKSTKRLDAYTLRKDVDTAVLCSVVSATTALQRRRMYPVVLCALCFSTFSFSHTAGGLPCCLSKSPHRALNSSISSVLKSV